MVIIELVILRMDNSTGTPKLLSPNFDVSLRVSILEYFKNSLSSMQTNLYVDIYNFKTCYFINGKEAISVLFRRGVGFSRVPGVILHFSHTILYWSYIAMNWWLS